MQDLIAASIHRRHRRFEPLSDLIWISEDTFAIQNSCNLLKRQRIMFNRKPFLKAKTA